MNKQDLMHKNFSTKLLCLDETFDFLVNLYDIKKLPRALMLTGKKGCGKSTLIIHVQYVELKSMPIKNIVMIILNG